MVDSNMKEWSRRRTFLWFLILIVAVFGYTVVEESDKPLHAMDEYVLVGMSIIGIIHLGLNWKADSTEKLKMQNNVVTALLAVALVFKIIAIPIEISDAADFGNDIPGLIVLVTSIVSRWL